jgi:uncharacterized protein (TIGR03435 family)
MPIRRSLLLFAFGTLAIVGPLACAQTTLPLTGDLPAKPLIFASASLQPTNTHQYNGVDCTADGANATGISLQNIIRDAYNEHHDQFWSGEPAWIATQHYNLSAKFDPADVNNITEAQCRIMLQTLLAERFRLVVRRETKSMPHYALAVAPGGSRMQETRTEDIRPDAENKLYCQAGLSNFKQCTMAEFAYVVSWFGPNTIVENHTGLTARYDFTLRWVQPGTATAPSSSNAAPDIFHALPEQLGLQLEPITGPIDTFIIDHIEGPSEN